jgi:hypothetical protein
VSVWALWRAGAGIGTGVVVALSVAACAEQAPESVVARVGHVPITKAALAREMSRAVSGATRISKGQQRRALEELLAEQWLIGASAERGKTMTQVEVNERLAKRRREFPNGPTGWREYLEVTGQSVADVRRAIRRELAISRLRQSVRAQEVAITGGAIRRYFDRHKRHFVVPERRSVELAFTRSKPLARKIGETVRAGRSLAGEVRGTGLELRRVAEFQRNIYTARSRGGDGGALERAIFSARRNVVMGPLREGRNYFVFRVTRVVGPTQMAPPVARRIIARQLTTAEHNRVLGRIAAPLEQKWIAQTDCRPGYVVERCRQFRGVRRRAGGLFTDWLDGGARRAG